ncbi:MAG: preprotein translocase subunit SecE [Planctomycetes bacterium]|nr:preprotein translocase subunit SecE [Planctomycetota bacterium]
MYKWPQGRVIRTACLVLTLLIALDLAYNGAYGPFSFYFEGKEGAGKQLALGIFFAVVAVAALLAGLVAIGFHRRAVDFLIEVEQEMVNVEWPKPNALVKSTIIIAIAIVILGFLIFAVDFINIRLLGWVQSSFGRPM